MMMMNPDVYAKIVLTGYINGRSKWENIEIHIAADSFSIGRNSTCHFKSDNPCISGVHCILTKHTASSDNGGGVVSITLSDLSTNRCHVNGIPLGKGKSVRIYDGDRIDLVVANNNKHKQFEVHGVFYCPLVVRPTYNNGINNNNATSAAQQQQQKQQTTITSSGFPSHLAEAIKAANNPLPSAHIMREIEERQKRQKQQEQEQQQQQQEQQQKEKEKVKEDEEERDEEEDFGNLTSESYKKSQQQNNNNNNDNSSNDSNGNDDDESNDNNKNNNVDQQQQQQQQQQRYHQELQQQQQQQKQQEEEHHHQRRMFQAHAVTTGCFRNSNSPAGGNSPETKINYNNTNSINNSNNNSNGNDTKNDGNVDSSSSAASSFFPQHLTDTSVHQDYVINYEKVLGKGTFASVFAAVSRKTGERFAVKEISKKKLEEQIQYQIQQQQKQNQNSTSNNQNNNNNSKQVERRIQEFHKERERQERESEILRCIDHPHVIGCAGIYETDDKLWFVLEYCDGGELFSFLKQFFHVPIPHRIVQIIMKQIAEALWYLHRLGICHRDIKLENILLLNKITDIQKDIDKIHVKVSDFGLSRLKKNESSLILSMCGTPAYVAPEVVDVQYRERQGGYTPSVDVFSLGVIGYAMLVGRAPFEFQKHNNNNRTQQQQQNQQNQQNQNQQNAGNNNNNNNNGKQQQQQSNSNRMNYEEQIRWPSKSYDNVSAVARDCVEKMLRLNPNDRIKSFEILQHDWLVDVDIINSTSSSSSVTTSSSNSTCVNVNTNNDYVRQQQQQQQQNQNNNNNNNNHLVKRHNQNYQQQQQQQLPYRRQRVENPHQQQLPGVVANNNNNNNNVTTTAATAAVVGGLVFGNRRVSAVGSG